MLSMKKKIEKVIPGYGILLLVLVLSMNMITYFGTRIFTQKLEHHVLASPLDDLIPFCPFFISFYILAYIQWCVGFVMIAREEKCFCYRFLFGEMIAKFICLLCFVIYPTTIVRPEIAGNGIWEQLTALIYRLDAPDNLFPSIHCLESWVCFRAAIHMKNTPKWYTGVMFVSSMLVFSSTVFVKQHVVIDMFGAVAACEIGFFIMGLILKEKK